jgi:hypothetical protein
MAIFKEHKYEKQYLERLHNPATAHKAITKHMSGQARTSEPQPDKQSPKSKAIHAKMGESNEGLKGMKRKELNEHAKKLGGKTAKYIGLRGSFTGR